MDMIRIGYVGKQEWCVRVWHANTLRFLALVDITSNGMKPALLLEILCKWPKMTNLALTLRKLPGFYYFHAHYVWVWSRLIEHWFPVEAERPKMVSQMYVKFLCKASLFCTIFIKDLCYFFDQVNGSRDFCFVIHSWRHTYYINTSARLCNTTSRHSERGDKLLLIRIPLNSEAWLPSATLCTHNTLDLIWFLVQQHC